MKTRFYLAYGSNLNLDQMKYRCPGARVVGTAEIEGYELLFKGSQTGAYLTIEKKEGGIVPVAVWEVTDFDEDRLDVYEGYPRFYYKKNLRIDVECFDNDEIVEMDAFVYIMHEDRKLGTPSDYYVAGCLEGYREFDFDEDYIWEAYKKSMRVAG